MGPAFKVSGFPGLAAGSSPGDPGSCCAVDSFCFLNVRVFGSLIWSLILRLRPFLKVQVGIFGIERGRFAQRRIEPFRLEAVVNLPPTLSSFTPHARETLARLSPARMRAGKLKIMGAGLTLNCL